MYGSTLQTVKGHQPFLMICSEKDIQEKSSLWDGLGWGGGDIYQRTQQINSFDRAEDRILQLLKGEKLKNDAKGSFSIVFTFKNSFLCFSPSLRMVCLIFLGCMLLKTS